MAYNNNNNGGGWSQPNYSNSFRQSGYQGGGYSRQSSGGYGKNFGASSPKKSGATYSLIRKGKHEGQTAVNAWRKTKFGLQTATAFPVDGTIHESRSGKRHMRYVVEITNPAMGVQNSYWCIMELGSKKIFIKELNLVISPNGNGLSASGKRVTGYFGRAK